MKKIILITILTGMIYCQSDDRYPYFSERAGDWVNPYKPNPNQLELFVRVEA